MASPTIPGLDLLLDALGTSRRRSDASLPLQAASGAGSASQRAAEPEAPQRSSASGTAGGVTLSADPDPARLIDAMPAAAPSGNPSVATGLIAAEPVSLIGRDPLSQALGSIAVPAGGQPGGAEQPRTCQCPLCRQMVVERGAAPEPVATATTTVTGVTLASSLDLASTFLLHSNPTATKTIYLDFNGHTTTGTAWNSSTGLATITSPAYDFDGNVNLFSNAELLAIQGIWQRVVEDFAPFNVNVTTEDPGVSALTRGDVSGDSRWGARCVIGGSSYDWFGSGAGGVSYVNVFGNAYYSPSFVFDDQLGNGNEKYTAEAISHEVGHALGLIHDGTSSVGYYQGQGSGATGWAPIMGVGYYQPVSQWSKGEYANANNKEDDLAIIAGSSNGFGYRADQAGNSAATASDLSGSSFSRFGIIETSSDSDWYRFTTGSGSVSLSIANACQAWSKNADGSFTETLLSGRSPNLDIQASLYRASDMALIATSNPLDSLSASFNLNLEGGTYLLSIDGVGFGDPASTGYSDYGSLGQYLISGSVVSAGSLIVTAASTLLTSEAGGSATFSVRLSQAPTADVVVALTSNDTTEGLLSTGQLVFNASNWATDQLVTLSGVDDLLVDGSQAYTVSLATSSTDSAFQGLPLRTLNASNADNDTPGSLIVTAASTLLTSEAGGSATFSVRLSQAPTADVVVTLTSNDTTEGLLSTGQLVFNASNWATDQRVTLSGVDDLLVDGSQAYTVSLATSSTDSAFQGLPLRTLNASNADNDTALTTLVTSSQGNLNNRISYTSAPTVSGKVTASAASDNVYLAITEGTTRSGSKENTSALDGYQWRFDNLVNASQLLFEGYRTANSEGDDFQFLISTNSGSSWTPVLTVANSSETTLSANLAAPVTGTALVRVVDTGRTTRQTNLDTLFVDQLLLVGQQIDLRPELKVTTTAAQAVESLGRAASFTIQRGGDLSRDLDVAFTLSGTAVAGSDYTVLDEAGNSLAGRVRIGAGQNSALVRIQPIADGVADGDETVLLSLAAPGDMLRLGASSNRAVIADSLTGTPAAVTAAAIAATTTGLLSGTTTIAATAAADGVVTTVSEVLTGNDGSATSQLEQRWSFQGLTGANRFLVKASASSGGDDSFRFEYQLAGSSKWTSLTSLNSGYSGTNLVTLGSTLSGDLSLRVIDSNRMAGFGLIDSISIDAMAFLAPGTPLPF